MIKVLEVINNEMKRLGINYLYDDWTSDVILPYCVGELQETPVIYETNQRMFNFILTCEDVETYTNLFNISEKLKSEYKHNHKIVFDGGVIVISYENTITIPVEAEEIKRIQINITVRLWED